MCKTIKQVIKFKVPADIIYSHLIDSKKHKDLTGKEAQIQNHIGGEFTVFDGDIKGINVDLVPSVRIVQAWRSKKFPEGIFSMASFFLQATAEGGTKLILTHRGVPKDLISEIENHWKEFYWKKIKNYES